MAVAVQPDQEMAAHWKSQIASCDKENDKWHKRATKILRHYRDERDDNSVGVARRLNLFWANTETLKPAIYSKTPVPICERRFLDKDTTGRMASTILERNLRYEVQMSGFDSAVRRARNDYLLVGRGQVWLRYYPLFGEPISPPQKGDDDITGPDGSPLPDDDVADEQDERELLRESLCVDYLHWSDYYTFPALARTEDEIEGKGRKLFMSRSDLIENFGEKIGKEIQLDHKPTDDNEAGRKASSASSSTLTGKDGMQATVYEIWWKPERKVYFIAQSYDKICKEVDDPLKLDGFFPCPAPINATMTNDTTIPVPDYAESQDQYNQIDDLTKRIDILTSATKVVGVYDAAAQSLKRVFEEASEPNLIPIDSWAMFAEKGGIKGAIDWVPIEQIATTLKILIEVRQQIIADLDRTTGISDIMRGTSDARETMGAQRLKTNNSATRLQERQDEMARFCRDIICIMGEIISEQYRPETLIQVSGAMYDEGLDPPEIAPQLANQQPPSMLGAPPSAGSPPAPAQMSGVPNQPGPMGQAPPNGQPPGMMGAAQAGTPAPPSFGLPQETPEQKEQRKLQLIMQAIDLLRQDKLRGFRIDIETDSTVQGDAQEEKAQRTEFIEQVTKFVETAAQTTAMVPEFAPLAAKMLQFAVRGFRVGRDLESAIEDFCEKAELDAKAKAANPQQKPDPETIKAETERMKAQAEIERQRVENEGEATNAQINLQSKQIDLQMKELELKIKMLDFSSKRVEAGQAAMEAGKEGDEVGVHPHMALQQIAEAAKVFDLASKRNAAPREIKRGPDGKATHIVTNFQEQ